MIDLYYKRKYKKLKEDNKKLQDDFDLLKFKYENNGIIKKIDDTKFVFDDVVILSIDYKKMNIEDVFDIKNSPTPSFFYNLFRPYLKFWNIQVRCFDKKNDKEVTFGIKDLKNIYND